MQNIPFCNEAGQLIITLLDIHMLGLAGAYSVHVLLYAPMKQSAMEAA